MITVIFHSHWIQTMTTQNYTNFINKVKYVSSFDSQWESTIKDPEFQDNLTPIISKPKLSKWKALAMGFELWKNMWY